MPILIEQPAIVTAAGNKPKRIEEFVGRVRSSHENISIARMISPGGWVEPGNNPSSKKLPSSFVGPCESRRMMECLKSEAGKQSSFVPANVFDTAHPKRMVPSMLLFVYRHSRHKPSIVAKNSFRKPDELTIAIQSRSAAPAIQGGGQAKAQL